MGGTCDVYWEKKNVYRVVIGKSEGRLLVGRMRLDERIIIKWIFERMR